MPGFEGAMAGKDELSELVEKFDCGGGDTGGLDQENVAAAGDAVLIDPGFIAGREGRIVEEEADVGAVAHGSALPPNMSDPVPAP